jgi:hypothetical protein
VRSKDARGPDAPDDKGRIAANQLVGVEWVYILVEKIPEEGHAPSEP